MKQVSRIQHGTIDDKLKRYMSKVSFEQIMDDHLLGDQTEPDPRIKKQIQYPTHSIKNKSESTPRGESAPSFVSSSSSSSNSASHDQTVQRRSSLSSNSDPENLRDRLQTPYSQADDDSLNSEQRHMVENLLPARKFGGKTHGVLTGSIEDGFADYRIYIKLLRSELKILLLPIYLNMIRMMDQHNQSNLGAGGHSALEDSLRQDEEIYSYRFESSRSESAQKILSYQYSKDLESSDDNPFRDRIRLEQDAKLYMYHQFFHNRNQASESNNKKDTDEVITLLEREIDKLDSEVQSYSSRNLIKIQRMGLAKFKKSFLKQHLFYLKGLLKYTTQRKHQISSESIKFFYESLKCSGTRTNALSKKTFVKLDHILEILIEKKYEEFLRISKSFDLRKLHEKGLSRRLTKLMERRHSTNKEETNQITRAGRQLTFKQKSQMVASHDDSRSFVSDKSNIRRYGSPDSEKKELKRHKLEYEMKKLINSKEWVNINLSQFIVSQRSICFVLDTYFDHYKQ